jgi:hypothetical protein
MLNINNKVISQLNTSNNLMNRFVRLKGQLDTKCASYLRYLATKNAINRAVDYHYLGLAVQESTAPVNGIDYIHPVVKPAVDYVSAVIVKGLAPDGEINMEFMPENEQDADAARQASNMVDFVLNRENDPHFILQRWVMDACMHKNGMLMVLPKREQIVRYVESSGTLDQLRAFETQAEESGLTVLRQSRRKTGVDMPAVMKEIQARAPGLEADAAQGQIDATLQNLNTAIQDETDVEQPDAPELGIEQEDLFAEVVARNTQYTAKYKLTGWNLQIKFRNIAQHYWICDPTVQEMRDQAFCGYYDPMSIQEAVYLYPELNDHLEEFREFAEYNQNGAYQAGSVLNNLAIHARDSVPVQGIPVMSGVGSDPDSRQVTILTVWDRYDIDGDGELELIEIVYSGTYIISAREVEFIPVANMCPKPLPGNFYGMSVGESVIPMQEYMTSGSRAEILLGLLTATPRLGVKPDRVDFEMMQDGEAAIFILDSKFDPAKDIYPMPAPAGNLGFIENAMTRMQQDTAAMIGMTQPGDVFNPEVMAAGNSGEKLAMALGPNQIIQDNAVRNSADGLKEAIYLIWRTLIQYGDDYGVKKMAQKFSPTQEPVFLDYKAWDEMNVFERKQIHIELALGMMSDDNRVKRQQLIQQTQMGFVGQIQALQQQGIFDMVLIEKIKRPFADTLYAVGVKNCDTYLPTDKEIEAMIEKAQQQAQQAQEQAKTNPPAEELYKKSQASLNDAKIQEIQAKIGGEGATQQLNYMAIAAGDPKVYHD